MRIGKKIKKRETDRQTDRQARIILFYLFCIKRNDAPHLSWLIRFVEIVDLQTGVKGERDDDLKNGQEVRRRQRAGIRWHLREIGI